MQNCSFIFVVNEIKMSLSLNCVVFNCDSFPGAALTICKCCSTLQFVANVAQLQVILLACALPSITVNCASIFVNIQWQLALLNFRTMSCLAHSKKQNAENIK